MAYFLDNYPISEECVNLVLTEEQEKNLRVVYKLDNEGGACFDGFWIPEAEYSDEYVIVPIRSTGFTVTDLDPKSPFFKITSFANVIGSKDDPKIDGKSWKELWKVKANSGKEPTNCSSDGFFYTLIGESEIPLNRITMPRYNDITRNWEYYDEDATCSGSIVGGHIIVNAINAATVAEGSGSVYIIPICNKHNIAFTNGKRFGEGFYMKLRERTNALKLRGYLKNTRKYLEEFKDEVRHE